MWVRTDYSNYIVYLFSFLVPYEKGVEILRDANRQSEDTNR